MAKIVKEFFFKWKVAAIHVISKIKRSQSGHSGVKYLNVNGSLSGPLHMSSTAKKWEEKSKTVLKSPYTPCCHHYWATEDSPLGQIHKTPMHQKASIHSFHPARSCIFLLNDVPHNFATFEEPFTWQQFALTLYILLATEPNCKSFMCEHLRLS